VSGAEVLNKKTTMNVVICLQIAIEAKVGSYIVVAGAKISIIEHAKIYQIVPEQKRSFA
jgi:hypothetical protein